MPAPSLPFGRVIQAGDRGDDVLALKIIVSRAGCWPWAEFNATATPEFMGGKGTSPKTTGLKGLQRKLGVKPDGVYGARTHAKTLPYRVPKSLPHGGEYVWDGHSQALYRNAYPDAHRRAVVTDIWAHWEWMVTNEPRIGYSQNRPMRELSLHHDPPRLPFDEDCSSTFIYCAFLAGALSPDRAYGYTGYGNTGSLIQCGIPIRDDQIEEYQDTHYLGVIYGANIWSTHHISAIRRRNLLYSMGRQAAPERWTSIGQGPGPVAGIRAYPVA